MGGGEGSLDEGERGVGRQEVADAKVVKVGAGRVGERVIEGRRDEERKTGMREGRRCSTSAFRAEGEAPSDACQPRLLRSCFS